MPFTLGKLYAHKNGVFTAQLSKFHCTKTGKHMGALRETPRDLGFCSPGSPRFHFTFHFRIHFHKNRLFKCTCEAKPKILTKRWGGFRPTTRPANGFQTNFNYLKLGPHYMFNSTRTFSQGWICVLQN